MLAAQISERGGARGVEEAEALMEPEERSDRTVWVEELGLFSLFYYRSSEAEWQALATPEARADFVASINSVASCPQQVDLPSYPDFSDFADRRFVGGLRGSIVAVESLYRRWTEIAGAQLTFAHDTGFYDSDSAAHMRYLYQSLGIELDPQNILPPDHLSLLLGFLALLVEHSTPADSCTFIDEHLDWLPELSQTIRERAPDVGWLLALNELLIEYLKNMQRELRDKEVSQYGEMGYNQEGPDCRFGSDSRADGRGSTLQTGLAAVRNHG